MSAFRESFGYRRASSPSRRISKSMSTRDSATTRRCSTTSSSWESTARRRVARMPSPTVAALVGSQYYWIFHYHPVALLGFVALFVEGHPPTPQLIEVLNERTGFPPRGVPHLHRACRPRPPGITITSIGPSTRSPHSRLPHRGLCNRASANLAATRARGAARRLGSLCALATVGPRGDAVTPTLADRRRVRLARADHLPTGSKVKRRTVGRGWSAPAAASAGRRSPAGSRRS